MGLTSHKKTTCLTRPARAYLKPELRDGGVPELDGQAVRRVRLHRIPTHRVSSLTPERRSGLHSGVPPSGHISTLTGATTTLKNVFTRSPVRTVTAGERERERFVCDFTWTLQNFHAVVHLSTIMLGPHPHGMYRDDHTLSCKVQQNNINQTPMPSVYLDVCRWSKYFLG